MRKMMSLVWPLALIVMIAFSCSKGSQPTSGEDPGQEEQISLDKEFGGYETTDEPVAFGDDELVSDSVDDQDVSDTYAADAAVVDALSYDGLRDSGDVKAYFLRITFGFLEGDTSATDIVDWSGSAEVDKGTLVVLKTVRFEDNDFVHLPRQSRQLVEFTAQTKPHFDGLVLAIIDNDSIDVPGTFTFNAGAYSRTLAFSELDSLELLDPVGADGHEVSIISRSKEYVPFAGGFVTGHWIKTGRLEGAFRGRWINSLGTNAGHLRGIWGVNRFGNKVFKGKYINFDGQFQGLLAGEWGFERGEQGGFFRGRWVNRNHDTVGIIRGKFRTGRPGDGRGFFHARYRVTNQDELSDVE